MKKILLTLLTLLTINSFAQVPGSINYQLLARHASGEVIADQPMIIRISILGAPPFGEVKYSETHADTSNSFGLINLAIGTGEVLSGSFGSLPWEAGNLFLKTEISIEGSKSFQDMGTTQLVSVPYAMYANSSGLKNVPALSQAEIDTLAAIAGTVVLNTSTDCLN